jgi:hypothetical protein
MMEHKQLDAGCHPHIENPNILDSSSDLSGLELCKNRGRHLLSARTPLRPIIFCAQFSICPAGTQKTEDPAHQK